MKFPEVYADVSLAKKILQQKYPDAQSIRFAEHGYDNLVGLVDEVYAVRFPRNRNAWLRSQYECEVLGSLTEIESTAIPGVLEQNEDPPYLVTSFLHGEHIASAEVAAFSLEEQKAFGREVATFAYRMHSLLSIEEAKSYRCKFELDSLKEEPWEIHLKKLLVDYTFPNSTQDAYAKEVYERWQVLNIEKELVVVHDDLHTENMFFDDNHRLVGVLDFGDTNIGTPEQEFRQLYRINDKIVSFAASKYAELSGRALDVDAIKSWSVAQELSAYAEHLLSGDINHPAFARAVRNLNKWFPSGEWGSRYGIQASDSKQ